MKNYYQILEVDKNASPEIIEKAYRTLVKKYHPDLQGVADKSSAEQMIKKINEAYDVLSDPIKKEQYDTHIVSQEISSEKYEELLNEKEYLKKQLNNLKGNNNDNKNTSYYNSKNEKYDPLKNPIAYYSETLKNYIDKNRQEKIDEEAKYYNKKMEDAYNKAYYDAYINNLKRQGYKIKYKKTFKDYVRIVLTILIMFLVVFILWHIPFINKLLTNIYNNNNIVKILVDLITQIFSSMWETITNPSLL